MDPARPGTGTRQELYRPPTFDDFPPDGLRTEPDGEIVPDPGSAGGPPSGDAVWPVPVRAPEPGEPSAAQRGFVLPVRAPEPGEPPAAQRGFVLPVKAPEPGEPPAWQRGVVLPVKAPEPGEPPAVRRGLVLPVVLIAGIAVAAIVVVITQMFAGRPSAPPAAAVSTPAGNRTAANPSAIDPSAAGPPPAEAPAGETPPGNVALRDNRDSVALSWDYPKGAEGPVLISGGRAGQPQQVFQQLPAGSADYIVYGLNNRLNYCFTVSVAYTAGEPAAAGPVCTRR